METPFAAYTGDEPYIFVCYAHENADVVYPDITSLRDRGTNVWYDEGISVGKVWREEIARAIRGSAQFIYFISRDSLASEHCNREVHFALDKGVEILPIYLENVELTDELELALGRVQALHRHADENYHLHLHESLGQQIESTPGAAREPVARSWARHRYFLATISVALLIGLGSWLWHQSAEPDPESEPAAVAEKSIPSIAVLPFVNMSDDPNQEFFSEGIAEEILSLIARNPKLKVISRYSAFSFKGKDLGIPAIASRLGVKHVLEGSVRKSGNQVRITTQLIDAEADRYLWSATFDRNLDDVFAVQTEIATHVSEQLNVALLDLKPRTYSEAYPLYSQARQLLSLDGTLDDTRRAKSLLDRANELDPSYAPAWREQARAYTHLLGHGVYTLEEGRGLSNAARAKALMLDPDDGVANAWSGWTLALRDNEFEKGVQRFKKGLSLDPTNLDILRPAVPLMHWFRKYQESLALAEYVVERDPLCVICIGNLAGTYMALDRLSDAQRLLRRGLTLSPDNAYMKRLLGANQLLQGDYQSALAWFEELPVESPVRLSWRAMALYELERQQEVGEALAKLEEQSAYTDLALYYAYTNDAGKALNALTHGIEAKQEWIQFFEAQYLWASDFTLDPDWQEFLEDVGLSEKQITNLDMDLRVPS